MKVLLDKKLAEGIQVKVVADAGKIIVTETMDVSAYLDKLKAKIPGTADDFVIDLVKGALAGA
jgi:hypothetical protein